MSECIFCKIASGALETKAVHSDERTFVFHDIAPQAPTHLLVIPKTHVEKLSDLDPEDMKAVHSAILKVVSDLKLDEAGYRVVVNQGKSAGQAVSHLHFHVLSGRNFKWPPG